MKHRRKLFPLVAMAACFGLVFSTALGDDPLKRGKSGGGGSGQGQGQKKDPPRRDPPRQDPPKQDPPRRDPPARQDPPRRDPPRKDPPRQDPPRQDPPTRRDPPTRQDPPRQDPPQGDPLRRGGGNERRGGGGNSGGSNSGGSQSGGSQSSGTQSGIPGGLRNPDRSGNSGSQNRGDGLLNKKSGSRSGSVQYGSNSNVQRDSRSGGFKIERAPIDIRRGSLGNQVRRSDEIRVNGVRIRFGYTHYNSRWCDDFFYYPHYVFDPYQNDFACSPWYYYPQLPPYFNSRRCYFPTSFTWSPFYGVRYQWSQPSRQYWNRDYNELDYVVEDIVSVFSNADRRAIGRLVPRYGQVGIIMDGRFAYSIRPDDFYDTLQDASENTRTTDYRIMDVQYRRDTASVFARHEFEDPWGRRTTVYHYFKLEIEGRNWVIREFGTSNSRW